jgi:allantoin racemase
LTIEYKAFAVRARIKQKRRYHNKIVLTMKLLVVNPNTTASMTAKIGAAARSVAAAGTEIVAVNPEWGPVSIEGYYDEVLSVPGLLEEVTKGQVAGCQGTIIACFDDTGLDAARTLVQGPVVGICEAAMHMSTWLGGSFSAVSTLKRSVPAIEALARRYGMSHHCRRVRAVEVPVLALEEPTSGASARIRAEIAAAIAEDRAECIILGCAGMADLAPLPPNSACPSSTAWPRPLSSLKVWSALVSPPVKSAATLRRCPSLTGAILPAISRKL